MRPARAILPLVLAALLCCAGQALAQNLRVMTFNVRYPNPRDGDNIWANRRAVFVRTVQDAQPDLIGTQELFASQAEDMVQALPSFTWFGRDRYGGHADEHMGIFYRSDRLRLLRHGDFWLSDRPTQKGSTSWGADLPRMVNWGVFETLGDKPYRFLMLDTHFAHRDRIDDEARRRSADLIVKRLPALARGLPVVLTSDLNAIPSSAAHASLTSVLTDVWQAAPTRTGPNGTFHDFTGRPGQLIDYVMTSGFRPIEAHVLTTHDGDRYPSDHFPILAVLAPARTE